MTSLFLSTLSLRRATGVISRSILPQRKFLSTLSLRRATLAQRDGGILGPISIHALLAESDRHMYEGYRHTERFLSTLSLRRATTMGVTVLGIQHNFYPRSPCGERRRFPVIFYFENLFLSTLSLRRATLASALKGYRPANFYPRSPCGERRMDSNVN